MSDEVNKIRTWFRAGDKDLNFPAWTFTVEEVQAMKIAGLVTVHGERYEIKDMVFDTAGEAMIFDLVRA
ncbi:hypothetical protein ACN6KS_22695 [Paenibacillus nitricinens]|uniref:hypothetical protein n=1 Tax=Paenibacillus nitricinens TaxID=3367691 RepID=UPI003F832277